MFWFNEMCSSEQNSYGRTTNLYEQRQSFQGKNMFISFAAQRNKISKINQYLILTIHVQLDIEIIYVFFFCNFSLLILTLGVWARCLSVLDLS